MADLDKKIQKTQTDLVQAVLEAQERKNLERVDTLITTAIKQLKMSRFKPDQTTCISLTYLAKTNPKIFSQSNAIKEVLKSMLRRETGPTNIKGKSDTVLPLLSANILLACCDCTEIRTIILNKIEHWLGANQRASDLIQHLLATLCMKCQGDQQTINSLIELRPHWLQYLEDNFEIYGVVPLDLCIGIRNLLEIETNCDALLGYLKFLIKHDTDLIGLAHDIGRLVVERPLSLDSMRSKSDLAPQLNKLILKVFIKLLRHLKTSKTTQDVVDSNVSDLVKRETEAKIKLEQDQNVTIKTETSVKTEQLKKEPSVENNYDEDNDSIRIPKLYVNLPDCSETVVLGKITTEAILTILSTIQVDVDSKEEFQDLKSCLIHQNENPIVAEIYEDYSMSIPYNMPCRLRRKLIQSQLDELIEFAMRNVDTCQLMSLIQLFGLSISTIDKIVEKLISIDTKLSIKHDIYDSDYLNEIVEFYSSIGVSGTKELTKRLNQMPA